MLLQILVHTPRWVFATFALLLYLGLRQWLPSRVGLARLTIMPIAMTGLSFYGVVSGFGDAALALPAWLAAWGVSFAIVLARRLPAGTSFDVDSRRFHLPGSAVPLALMMGIFATKYGVGVWSALNPGWTHRAGFVLAASIAYGVFSGIFAARAARLWRLAIGSRQTGMPIAPTGGAGAI